MWDEVERDFDITQKGLLGRLMGKSLMQNEGYLELLRDSDGDDDETSKFDVYRIEKGLNVLSSHPLSTPPRNCCRLLAPFV